MAEMNPFPEEELEEDPAQGEEGTQVLEHEMIKATHYYLMYSI